MIASVRGVVLSAGLDCAVVDIGGVGLFLHTTAGTAASLRPGAEAVLSTRLVVREESLTLYGFADEDERAVFTWSRRSPASDRDLPWRCWLSTLPTACAVPSAAGISWR